MSSKKNEEILREEKDWNRIDDAVFTSERFLAKYQKQILIAVGAVVVIVCAFFAYKTLYLNPKNEEAQVALIKGERYFAMQMDSLAIYGDGNGYLGFESIINEYGSTKAGSLAKYYAGVSYSRLGKYDQAIDHLSSFSADDEVVKYLAKGLLGDCYVNKGELEKGAKLFVEAAKGSGNLVVSPVYYKKAALVYRDLKDYDKVIELFTTVKDNYLASPEGAEADKYIEEAQLMKGAK